jgi:predicted MFS family arabinose efflux permease
MSGEIADQAGMEAAFLVLAGIGLLGLLAVWLIMPETRPSQSPLTQPVRE